MAQIVYCVVCSVVAVLSHSPHSSFTQILVYSWTFYLIVTIIRRYHFVQLMLIATILLLCIIIVHYTLQSIQWLSISVMCLMWLWRCYNVPFPCNHMMLYNCQVHCTVRSCPRTSCTILHSTQSVDVLLPKFMMQLMLAKCEPCYCSGYDSMVSRQDGQFNHPHTYDITPKAGKISGHCVLC